MILALDVDDVVLDLVSVLLEVYNAEWNDSLSLDMITDWDITQFVKPECGNKILDYFEDPSLYWAVEPMPGVDIAIQKIREYNRIVFVTHSTLGASGIKYTKLKELGFIEDQDDYIEAKDKTLINAELLIDDKIDTVQKYTDAFIGHGILFTRPWNAHYSAPSISRINSWKSFLERGVMHS